MSRWIACACVVVLASSCDPGDAEAARDASPDLVRDAAVDAGAPESTESADARDGRYREAECVTSAPLDAEASKPSAVGSTNVEAAAGASSNVARTDSFALDAGTSWGDVTPQGPSSSGLVSSPTDADTHPSAAGDRDAAVALDEASAVFDASDANALGPAQSEAGAESDASVDTATATTGETAFGPTDASMETEADARVSQEPGDAGVMVDASSPLPPPPVCPVGPFAPTPVPATVTFHTLCSGLTFTEGPVWVANGSRLFFSDFDNGSPETNFAGSIVEYSASNGCEVWLPATGSNGLALSRDGELIACRHTTQNVMAYDIETKVGRVLADNWDDSHFSSPNDLAARSDGNVYFSDPAWNLGNRSQELPQSLYRINPWGAVSVVEVLANQRPNGVALSPDESVLYVALATEIRRYDLDSAGAASNPRTFVSVGSDGLAMDCAGNLYVTTGGVTAYSPSGEFLDSLGATGNVTNLAFGGANRQTLFLTGGSSLRSVELAIPGMPY